MAILTIGNLGEVFYKDETSTINWTPQGEPTMVGTPNMELLTRHLYDFYLTTGTILLPRGPAHFPREPVRVKSLKEQCDELEEQLRLSGEDLDCDGCG